MTGDKRAASSPGFHLSTSSNDASLYTSHNTTHGPSSPPHSVFCAQLWCLGCLLIMTLGMYDLSYGPKALRSPIRCSVLALTWLIRVRGARLWLPLVSDGLPVQEVGKKSWTSRKSLGLSARPQCSSPSGHIWQDLFSVFPGLSEWTLAVDIPSLLPATCPRCDASNASGHPAMVTMVTVALLIPSSGSGPWDYPSPTSVTGTAGHTEVPKVLDVRGVNRLFVSGLLTGLL